MNEDENRDRGFMILIKIFGSRYFWLLIAGSSLLLLLTKDGFSKLTKIIKILGDALLKILDLIFALFNLKIERLTYFEEASET